jgi:hypothetical protein
MKIDKLNLDGKKTSIEVLDKIFLAKINKKLVDTVLYKTLLTNLLLIFAENNLSNTSIVSFFPSMLIFSNFIIFSFYPEFF